MHLVVATNLSATWWHYLVLFVAVAASWAGVPFVGATVAGAAGLAASQGTLDLAAVIVVATAAGELGGLIGYHIGFRWGRELLDRPGRHHARRQRLLTVGEQAYAKWGGLAVFFTPAIVSGTAKMRHGRFAFWNLGRVPRLRRFRDRERLRRRPAREWRSLRSRCRHPSRGHWRRRVDRDRLRSSSPTAPV